MTEAAHKRHDTAVALARIERDHCGWHCWVGVGGLLYARRERSSPPRVVRASTPYGLRAEVEAAEQRRGR